MAGTQHYTEAEMEEARYELWLMNGGRERATVKHARLANESLADLPNYGWRVLDSEVKDDHWHDISLTEAVVRRGDVIKIIRWKPFNKGWMEKSTSGAWIIFNPNE